MLQRADGKGRIVACEIMRHTQTIEECIVEPEKTHMIKEYILKPRGVDVSEISQEQLDKMVDIMDKTLNSV